MYRKGNENGNAGCMSRIPIKDTIHACNVENHRIELSISPVVFYVKRHSSKDPVISRVMDQVVNGELIYKGDNSEMERYMRHCYELSVEDCTLLRGNRVIPTELHETILRVAFFMHFYPGTITTHAESINSDLQRGLDRHLRHVQH